VPERENLIILRLGDRGSRCQEKAQFEAVWSGGKKGGSQVEIPLIHTLPEFDLSPSIGAWVKNW
jgi:hypothetical protein